MSIYIAHRRRKTSIVVSSKNIRLPVRQTATIINRARPSSHRMCSQLLKTVPPSKLVDNTHIVNFWQHL